MFDLIQNVLLIFIEAMCCKTFLKLLVKYGIMDGLI